MCVCMCVCVSHRFARSLACLGLAWLRCWKDSLHSNAQLDSASSSAGLEVAYFDVVSATDLPFSFTTITCHPRSW